MNFSSSFFCDPQQAVNIPFLYYKLLDQFVHITEFSTLGSHINASEEWEYRTIIFCLWSCWILWGILWKICLISSRVVYVEFDVDAEGVMGCRTNCPLRIRFHHWLLNKYYSYRIQILLKQYWGLDEILEGNSMLIYMIKWISSFWLTITIAIKIMHKIILIYPKIQTFFLNVLIIYYLLFHKYQS